MEPVGRLRVERVAALALVVDDQLKRPWALDDPDAWRAAGRSSGGEALAAGGLDPIAHALEGEPLGPALQQVYDAIEADWCARFGEHGVPELVVWEEQRHALDGPLIEALQTAQPAEVAPDRLVHALLVALEQDTGGLTLSTARATPRRLVQSSMRRAPDRLRHTRIDAAWVVLVAFLHRPRQHEDRLRRLITVLRDPPPPLADPLALDPAHPGSDVLAPLVRWSQLPHFRGLRYDLPDVRRAFAAGAAQKADALLGMALLLAEPGPFRQGPLEQTLRPVCERWNVSGSRFRFTASQLDRLPEPTRLPPWLAEAVERVQARSQRPTTSDSTDPKIS